MGGGGGDEGLKKDDKALNFVKTRKPGGTKKNSLKWEQKKTMGFGLEEHVAHTNLALCWDLILFPVLLLLNHSLFLQFLVLIQRHIQTTLHAYIYHILPSSIPPDPESPQTKPDAETCLSNKLVKFLYSIDSLIVSWWW